jgi:ATP-dependent DNA helicase Q1
MIKEMVSYILEHHKGCSGIVYCLSKKDTETVATGLEEMSNGAIKTGVYHSEVGDSAKETLHQRWRKGKVDVVCATIAFGMGIDKGDVRFVIHHSVRRRIQASLPLD